jgi:hypothetical protein
MESLTRLVSESLARHGFERPLDYRRLRWSRWFRCESHHSLLQVPSKAGVFALAEEIVDFDGAHAGTDTGVEERRFSAAFSEENSAASAAEKIPGAQSRKPESALTRRMLAVAEFHEADDMAFVLDRMLARPNSMRDRLASGRYFIRFVIIEDVHQRRSVYNALNRWIADQSAAATAGTESGIASHFASSLELTPATEYVPGAQASLFESASVGRTLMSANAGIAKNPNRTSEIKDQTSVTAQPLNSEAATNIFCPSPLPSGF